MHCNDTKGGPERPPPRVAQMLALESETLVVWASSFLLGRKAIVIALSSVSPTCHQLGAEHAVGSGMGPPVTRLTENF